VQPYLYAKTLFRSRSQDRAALKADELFFQALFLNLEHPLMHAFLMHPGYTREKKVQMLSQGIATNYVLEETQRSLLAVWIDKKYLKNIRVIYQNWHQLVEDHLKTGCIVIESAKPLAESAVEGVMNLFATAYPKRHFTIQYRVIDHVGYTAQFRDSMLDLRAPVLLKKFILSLKEGF